MRIKATLTAEWEYEVAPKDYPLNSSKDAILQIDKDIIETSPQEFVDLWDDVKVELEIIE